jgi:hypothetical protein
MDPNSGQYPEGSRGYPKYRFGFVLLNGGGDFVISPHTREGGFSLNRHLANAGFKPEVQVSQPNQSSQEPESQIFEKVEEVGIAENPEFQTYLKNGAELQDADGNVITDAAEYVRTLP